MKTKQLCVLLISTIVLFGCSNDTSSTSSNNSSTNNTSSSVTKTSVSSTSKSSQKAEIQPSFESSSKSEEKEVVTAESLMADYPAWSLETGITPAEYNENRRNEANKRLAENGLPADDDFINRNPIIINRDTEKEVYKMIGYPDYTRMEANVVINGVMVIE